MKRIHDQVWVWPTHSPCCPRFSHSSPCQSSAPTGALRYRASLCGEGRRDRRLVTAYSAYYAIISDCHVCHGPDGLGSSFGPALADSLKTLTYDQFIDTVTNGRKNVNTSNSTRSCRSFGLNPNVMCYVDDIYAYLKARSDGKIPPCRPADRDYNRRKTRPSRTPGRSHRPTGGAITSCASPLQSPSCSSVLRWRRVRPRRRRARRSTIRCCGSVPTPTTAEQQTERSQDIIHGDVLLLLASAQTRNIVWSTVSPVCAAAGPAANARPMNRKAIAAGTRMKNLTRPSACNRPRVAWLPAACLRDLAAGRAESFRPSAPSGRRRYRRRSTSHSDSVRMTA